MSARTAAELRNAVETVLGLAEQGLEEYWTLAQDAESLAELEQHARDLEAARDVIGQAPAMLAGYRALLAVEEDAGATVDQRAGAYALLVETARAVVKAVEGTKP